MDIDYSVKTTKGDYTLVRTEFSDIEFSICLPEILSDLSEEDLNNNFPKSHIPMAFKSNPEYKMTFTLAAAPHETNNGEITDEELKDYLLIQRYTISRLVPGYDEFGVRSKVVNDHTVMCIEYKSNSLENDLYNVFFLCLHNGNMIHGAFSCHIEDQAECGAVFLMCLSTIKFAAKMAD